MEQTDTDNTKTNKLDAIDAVRAFAIMLIFFTHAAGQSGLPLSMGTFIFRSAAWAGVWIFFIVSGYLIGGGFRDRRYKNTLDYLKKRFVRVAVPYYVFMFTVLLLLYPEFIINEPIAVLRIITFTYNGAVGEVAFTAMWFVSTLMQFYIMSLFFQLLVKKIEKKKYACEILFLFVFAAGFILRWWLYDIDYGFTRIYTSSWTNMDVFFCGFLFSWIMKNRSTVKRSSGYKQTALAVTSVAVLLSLAVFFAYCVAAGRFIDPMYLLFYRAYGPTLIILAICLYIYSLDNSVKKNNERLSLSAVRRNPLRLIECFAVISLGFYFWHSIIIFNVASTLDLSPDIPGHLILLTVSAVLAILMATIFYYSVEKWSARLLKRLGN